VTVRFSFVVASKGVFEGHSMQSYGY